MNKVAVHAGPPTRPPILSITEASRRALLLAALRSALAEAGIQSVLARNQRLVLRYNDALCEPSGPTEPQLHVLPSGAGVVVTTDGACYRLATGQACDAASPGEMAAVISRVLGWAGAA